MQDLTVGPVTKHLLKTTGFMLVMMVFQTLYFLIDLYWVGRLGTTSVAAGGLAGNTRRRGRGPGGPGRRPAPRRGARARPQGSRRSHPPVQSVERSRVRRRVRVP